MKYVFTICLVVFITITTSTVYSQGVFNDPQTDTYITQKKISQPLQEYEYTGTPYANKSFQPGYVYRNGVPLASNVGLRYNALRDEFEIKKSVNTSNYAAKVLKLSADIYVKILNKLYVYILKVDEDNRGGYFEVIYDGESLSLYKKISKKYIEGKKAVSSIAPDILPMYKEKEILYLVSSANEFSELPGSRNGKINSFPENKKLMKQHIREKNLNINKVYDLIKLLTYYNTLTKS